MKNLKKFALILSLVLVTGTNTTQTRNDVSIPKAVNRLLNTLLDNYRISIATVVSAITLSHTASKYKKEKPKRSEGIQSMKKGLLRLLPFIALQELRIHWPYFADKHPQLFQNARVIDFSVVLMALLGLKNFLWDGLPKLLNLA